MQYSWLGADSRWGGIFLFQDKLYLFLIRCTENIITIIFKDFPSDILIYQTVEKVNCRYILSQICVRVIKPRGYIIAGTSDQLKKDYYSKRRIKPEKFKTLTNVLISDNFRILNQSMKNIEVLFYYELINNLNRSKAQGFFYHYFVLPNFYSI